jgi:L-Ala-D/L-Glu epimerase
MMIRNATYYRYTIPFRIPFQTSYGTEQNREGLLVRVRTEAGASGYGEAVSLPTFGTGTLEELEQLLEELIERLPGLTVIDAFSLVHSTAPNGPNAPIRFALDTALLDLQAQEAGVPIAKLIRPDAATSVPLNATISQMETAGAASAAYYAAVAGYGAIKMKAGPFSDPALEIERVAAVREAIGPDIKLRIDPNGSWSFSQAIEIARSLEQFDIEYIEQPLPTGSIDELAALRREISIPLAADEIATSHQAVEELIEQHAADVIVIKPAVVGGIKIARELVHLANSAGIRVVVTSALESGVGIVAALHLAATLDEPIPACGLATGSLLESDLLIESSEIANGRMAVPMKPGLGVEPHLGIWQ